MTQPTPAPGPTSTAEDRRQHLSFIQACIARMSSASAVAKGWALTVATATYGYAGTKGSVIVALLGLSAVLLFASLDARYLREERRYRRLYDDARTGRVTNFEMNAMAAQPGQRRWSDYQEHLILMWSWSVRDFYGFILLAGVALLAWLFLCR